VYTFFSTEDIRGSKVKKEGLKMKKTNLKAKLVIAGLILLGLGVSAACVSAGTPQSETPPQKSTTAEYVPGELIVKLKEGKSLGDIQGLNKKYNVTTTEPAFKKMPMPQETLKELKNKLAKIGLEHEKWYWQMDRDSQEYQDYMAKIEKEKAETQSQIKSQEEIIAALAAREKSLPKDTKPANLDNIYLLKTPPETHIPLMMQDYSQHPAVLYAEPNYIAHAAVLPNDPYYSTQWALPKIQADSAWDSTKGDNVIIAIIDTGVDYNHQDLQSKVIRPGGYDFINNDSDPLDDHSHGTHCAGISAASTNNGIGVAGIGWNARILGVKVLNKDGQGDFNSITNGVKFAADNGARVISMSLGGYPSMWYSPQGVMQDAVDYAFNKGCIVVAAAMNDNTSTTPYPAGCNNVVAVAATDQNDDKASFSNYGSWVDIAAPGVNIRSTVVNNNYEYYQGTSMACPYVSGTMALVVSQNPNLSNREVVDKVLNAADKIDRLNSVSNGRRLNTAKAVTPTTTDTTAPGTPVVTDEGQTTTNQNQLYASWASSDPESGIAEYQYAIGTTQGATDVRAWTSAGTNTYVTAGGLSLSAGKTYYFGVKAKNGAGLWSAAGYSDGIKVESAQPTDTTKPTITHTPITQAEKNKAITFEATVTDTDSGVKSVWVSYAIDKTLTMSAAGNNLHKGTLSSDQVQSDITYSIKAEDNAGNLATTSSYTIKVSAPATTNQPPVAKITASPTLGRSPLKVSFNAGNSTDADGTIVKYLWRFDTGAISTAKTVSRTYRWSGNWLQLWFRIPKVYTATLTVTDDKGATGTASTRIYVYPW
jgi:thermitase